MQTVLAFQSLPTYQHNIPFASRMCIEDQHQLFLVPYRNHSGDPLLHPLLIAANFQPGSDTVSHSIAKCC